MNGQPSGARLRLPADLRTVLLVFTDFWPVVYLKRISESEPVRTGSLGRWLHRMRTYATRLFETAPSGEGRTPQEDAASPGFEATHGRWDILPGETREPSGARDKVAEGSMESFPASDPPSYMG